ncbi:HTTM domain-containing protein [Haladaptatus salinisoli]|uniref:HTTM domain-containing protein n=1 Tax=Haladaptatus salinisoli TaxID=2884876 RepID=UPI001D0A050B|nr:HTTM domain-containing protein [Haladaptatus salinisoli]
MNGCAFVAKAQIRGRDALFRRFDVDTRALAALRISLGVFLLTDLLLRSRDLVAHYTDAGVLPRSLLFEQFPGFSRLSIHALSGDVWMQVLLFLVAGAVALSLLLGYRTTLATLASLVLLVSLQARNPLVLNAGDSVLRRLLIWGLFLPLGERWSVDSLCEENSQRRTASVASAALLVQVVIIYTVNGLLKLRGDLWIRGDAIRYVFSLDQLTVLLGDYVAQVPTLLRFFSKIWLAMVLSSVLLLLLTGWSRALFAALFAAMHFGMFLTMNLGLFPLISIAALIPFFPGVVWDAAERRFPFDATRLHRWRDRIGDAVPITAFSALPTTVGRWKRRVVPAVVTALLLFVLVWNAASLGYAELPTGADSAVNPEERRWDMFAPEPRGTDGWYAVPGRLESGERVDAFHRSAVRWERPREVAQTYPTHRWLVYLLDLRRARNDDLDHRFAGYLCHQWNSNHQNKLVNVTVYYVEQPTRLDGPESTSRVELVQHSCSSGGSS